MDQTAFHEVTRTSEYAVLQDESQLGLVVHELFTPGPGVYSPYIPVNIPAVKWAQFFNRVDLPLHTVVRCTDVGATGSYWRWTGTAWVPDRFFMLALAQGSMATPLNQLQTLAVGFNTFGGPITPPAGFWATGRRLRLSGNVLRPSSTSITTATRLRVGGVDVVSAAWNAGAVAQHFEIDLWVSAANQVTVSVTVIYVVAAPPESLVETASDYTVANLNSGASVIELGIYDSTAESGNYKLLDFPIEVVA